MGLRAGNAAHGEIPENSATPHQVFSFQHVHPRYHIVAVGIARRILANRIGGMKVSEKPNHAINIFSNHVGTSLNQAFWARMNIREISKGVRQKTHVDDSKIITTTEMLSCLDQKLLKELIDGNIYRTGHRKGMDESTAMSLLLDLPNEEWKKDPQKAECLELLKLDLFWRQLNLANRGLLGVENG